MAFLSSLPLLLLLLLLLHLHLFAASSDIELLLSFKSSLPNPDVLHTWKKLSSSSSSSSYNPCSSFYGVSCSSSSDATAITSVHLDSVQLNADFRHVAAYLLPISSLVSLSLGSSNITGFLSAGGSNCAGTLQTIDLSGNAVQGSVTDLPWLSSACSGLKFLNLSGNAVGFSPRDLNSVAEAKLLGVVVLDLSFNKIAGGVALGWIFSASAGVKHLDLSGNRMSGSIPAFSNCSQLEYLDISSN